MRPAALTRMRRPVTQVDVHVVVDGEERRVAELMELLGARTRFEAGVRSQRRQLLG
ncbi:hypothetical protein [Jiangella aurantiaca]|uniref:hypothetical protein n=1 Tax=Jiangella aurantiaca TaxID=2530373 RepID=UPI0013A5D1A9|nr:hypothetical protein [Jiangella aurantiaca]